MLERAKALAVCILPGNTEEIKKIISDMCQRRDNNMHETCVIGLICSAFASRDFTILEFTEQTAYLRLVCGVNKKKMKESHTNA